MQQELKEYYSRLQWKQAAHEALRENRKFYFFELRSIFN